MPEGTVQSLSDAVVPFSALESDRSDMDQVDSIWGLCLPGRPAVSNSGRNNWSKIKTAALLATDLRASV